MLRRPSRAFLAMRCAGIQVSYNNMCLSYVLLHAVRGMSTTGTLSPALWLANTACFARCLLQAAMVEHLSTATLRHWDLSMRQLGARALGRLVPVAPPSTRAYMAGGLVDTLVLATGDASLEVRDGAVWALAELVTAFSAPCGGAAGNEATETEQPARAIDAARCSAILSVPGALQAAQFLAGKGGETLRVATCRLIASASAGRMALEHATAATWLDVLESSLTHPVPAVQHAAADALPCFATYVDMTRLHLRCITLMHHTHTCCCGVHSVNGAVASMLQQLVSTSLPLQCLLASAPSSVRPAAPPVRGPAGRGV